MMNVLNDTDRVNRPSEITLEGGVSVRVRLRAAGFVSVLVAVMGFPLAGAVTVVFMMIALQDLSGAAPSPLPVFIAVGWCAAVAGVAVVNKLVKPYVSRVSASRLHSAPMIGCSAIAAIAVVGAIARFSLVGQGYWWLLLILSAPFLGAVSGSFIRHDWKPMIVGTMVAAVVALAMILTGL